MSEKRPARDPVAEAEAWAENEGDSEEIFEQWMFSDDPRTDGMRNFVLDTPDDLKLFDDFARLTGCTRPDLQSLECSKAFSLFRSGVLAGKMLANPTRTDSVAILDALRDGAGAIQAKRRRLLSLVKQASAYVGFSPRVVGAFICRAATTWPTFSQLDPTDADRELASVRSKDPGISVAARLSQSVNGFGLDGKRPLETVKRDFKMAQQAGRKRSLKG